MSKADTIPSSPQGGSPLDNIPIEVVSVLRFPSEGCGVGVEVSAFTGQRFQLRGGEISFGLSGVELVVKIRLTLDCVPQYCCE